MAGCVALAHFDFFCVNGHLWDQLAKHSRHFTGGRTFRDTTPTEFENLTHLAAGSDEVAPTGADLFA
jgi:hypothetical protein